ncbi:MAG: RecB family exonuclease, partial [Chloroflexota bacterium]
MLQFLDKYPQPIQALQAWSEREAEQTDDEMWQDKLRDNTVHVLQPSQVPPGGYRALWVSGLSEGHWPAVPSMRRLQTLATLRGRAVDTERAEHGAAERALWQAVQRGLDTGGQLHIHTLVGQESTLSRFVPQEETTEQPAMEALTPTEYGIWLERQARLSLTGAGDPLDRAARLALYAQQRDSVPRPAVVVSAPEPERSVWTEPVRVSPSQLEAYQACPQQFVYAYVYRIGLDDDEGYLGFGNLVHTLIQEAFTFALPAWSGEGEMPLAGMPASLPAGRRRIWLLERLYTLATSERYRFTSGYRAIELERRLKAFAFLQGVLDESPPDPEFTVLAVEHTLNASVPGLSSEEVTITGKIDRIDRRAGINQVKLWDFKTGKRPASLDLATIEGVQRKVRAA